LRKQFVFKCLKEEIASMSHPFCWAFYDLSKILPNIFLFWIWPIPFLGFRI
jgi:hypothetical protein